MYAPTERELIVLRAVLDEGSAKAAANRLCCAEQTIKNTLYIFRRLARCETTERLVYEYRDELRALKVSL